MDHYPFLTVSWCGVQSPSFSSCPCLSDMGFLNTFTSQALGMGQNSFPSFIVLGLPLLLYYKVIKICPLTACTSSVVCIASSSHFFFHYYLNALYPCLTPLMQYFCLLLPAVSFLYRVTVFWESSFIGHFQSLESSGHPSTFQFPCIHYIGTRKGPSQFQLLLPQLPSECSSLNTETFFWEWAFFGDFCVFRILRFGHKCYL